jgi:hypothetical protein
MEGQQPDTNNLPASRIRAISRFHETSVLETPALSTGIRGRVHLHFCPKAANTEDLNDGENELMKLRKADSSRVFLTISALLFAAIALSIPARAQQRGYIAANFGATADRFGGQSRETGAVGAVDGEVIVWKTSDLTHGVDIVGGGELRWPEDGTQHATEQSVYGGFAFHFGQHLTAGIHLQIHRLVPPPSYASGPVTNGGVVFNRDHMELFETPIFVQYKFGPSSRFFARVEGTPEFSPRFHKSPDGAPPFDNPNLDHGYAVRGILGYNFGRWFVKGTYQTRYFRFETNANNPDDVYNWRTDFVTGGVGLNF